MTSSESTGEPAESADLEEVPHSDATRNNSRFVRSQFIDGQAVNGNQELLATETSPVKFPSSMSDEPVGDRANIRPTASLSPPSVSLHVIMITCIGRRIACMH